MQSPDATSLAFQVAISCATLACEYLKGSKWPHVWKLALASQALWLSWIVYAGNWGLLPLTVCLTAVFVRNHLAWRRERLTVFGQRICQGCETQRNCAQHGCKNRVDHLPFPRTPPGRCSGCSMRGPQGQCCGVYGK